MDWILREGWVLAKQMLDAEGKVRGGVRGCGIVVKSNVLATELALYEGDEILFLEYAAEDVTIDGEKYLLIPSDRVFMRKPPLP